MNATDLAPSIANLIRADHSKVLATFHRYKTTTSASAKQAIVAAVCVSIEIHAQCEEEILYPAMRDIDAPMVDKNVPEHDEMRRLIATLKRMTPDNPQYDNTFMALMREVMHHVADEETLMLPKAERALGPLVNELGAAMLKRKLQLSVPRAGEMIRNATRAPQVGPLFAIAGALLAGVYLYSRGSRGA